MIQRLTSPLAGLYEEDETAWLDAMGNLIAEGRLEELDYPHLAEYLSDMAARERREVESRLATLLAHLLKWLHQPEQRTRSWRGTIIEQRQELKRHVGRGVLRNHAVTVLADVYAEAVERSAGETGRSHDVFPSECPFTLEQVLAWEFPAEA